MAEKTEVIVRQVNPINTKHIEADVKISLHEIDLSIDTQEEFRTNFKKWFAAQYNRSLQQAAEILVKMYPNQEADKETLLDATKQIMEDKINFLEDYLKKNDCKFA